MNLNDLIVHDSILISVHEDCHEGNLEFMIDWVGDSGNGPYKKATLKFIDVIEYEVHEIPFQGHPTILEIIEIGKLEGEYTLRKQLKIETNAGYRTLYCTGVELQHDETSMK